MASRAIAIALIGFVPLAVFTAVFPPPYNPWWDHPEWLPQMLTVVVSAVAAGIYSRLGGVRFLVAGACFCGAQAPLILLGNVGSVPDLEVLPQLPAYLLVSFLLSAMIAVIPLAVGYAVGARLPPSSA